jgi:hypothetical protein
MKEVPEMPTSGQFVTVWIYNGKVWSGTYRWRGENLFQYEEKTDGFTYPIGMGGAAWDDESLERKFFTA